MWLELTSESDEKLYVNADQFVVIYPVNENKLTRVLTPAGPIMVKEPLAFIQSKLEQLAAQKSV
ncbi:MULTISPECIES: hypothetical protein [unclassified Rhizobium]|uniref:hypothetical protein n=1 Tax=unclassified Rhizobium TaxID=2613769 RepID=UPI000716113A|nr:MULTISPECIES: hypothetical protein [unclassified Rhizobium]KQS85443.1 hypothetical protein ASG50_29185 [Rhizobium sp. Leaf386]KQU00851.1 hypothetical protein ASG68_29365 [Rhizobium sp. Leaf453]